MPGWLTILVTLVQEIPEIVAIIEKIVGIVSNAPDKKVALEAISKAVADLPK